MASGVAGTEASAATVVDVVVVDVVVVLVVLVLVDGELSVSAAAGSARGEGFCHTERDVESPKLGNKLSRMAYAAPADPSSTTAVRMANDTQPAERAPREPRWKLGDPPVALGV
jgi:hypothetical protein